jgi:hypothetical protein
MCKAYNAKFLPEVDRGKVVADFKRWTELKWLLKDPSSVISEKIKGNSESRYGINIGEGHNKEDGLIYLREYLYTPISVNENGDTVYMLQNIPDLPFLKELKIFKKGKNLDRVSMYIVAMFQRLAYRTAKRTSKSSDKRSIFDKIGLYHEIK